MEKSLAHHVNTTQGNAMFLLIDPTKKHFIHAQVFYSNNELFENGYTHYKISINDVDDLYRVLSANNLEIESIYDLNGTHNALTSTYKLELYFDALKFGGEFVAEQVYQLYVTNVVPDLEDALDFHKTNYIAPIPENFDMQLHTFKKDVINLDGGFQVLKFENKVVVNNHVYHNPYGNELEVGHSIKLKNVKAYQTSL